MYYQLSNSLRSISLLLALGAPGLCLAQSSSAPSEPAPPPPLKQAASPRAQAYYHFALGHYFEEMAGAYGNKAEYVNKAIENYRLAVKDDPGAAFLVEDIADLYRQAGRLREATVEAENAIKANPDDLNSRRVLARIYTQMIGDSRNNRINEDMVTKALDQYKLIGEKAPKDADTQVMLGRLYKLTQRSTEAESAYQKALSIDTDNEDALTGLALTYTDQGKSAEANKLLERLAKKKPSARALAALGASYDQMHEYSLAANVYRQALQLDPSRAEIKQALAQDLALSNQLEDAVKMYQELGEADPKTAQYPLRISQIYRQQHKLDLARKAIDQAKQLEPDNLEVRYNEVALLEAEGKTQEAVNSLKSVLSATAKKTYAPTEKGYRAMMLERLGLLYRSSEQYDLAVDAFQQISDLDPELSPRASAQMIETYSVARQYQKAEAEAEKAVKKFPNDRTLRSVRASLLANMGKSDTAIAELKKTLDGKNDHDTYVALAQVYEKTKNFTEMEKALDAAGKDTSSSKEDKATLSFMRGTMYERQKKFDLAEKEFRKVLEDDPENASAYNYLGYMLADRNERLTEAQQMIERALNLDPNNGAFLDSLGWVYFKQNRLDDAEQQLTRSLALISRDPTIHDHLGDVYFKKGKTREAIQQWQASLKEWDSSAPADREPDEVAKVQRKLDGAKTRLAKRQTPKSRN